MLKLAACKTCICDESSHIDRAVGWPLITMWLAGEADTGVCGRRWETWGIHNASVGDESSSSCASDSPSISPEPSSKRPKTPTSPHCTTGRAAHGGLEMGARPGKRARQTCIPNLPRVSRSSAVNSGFVALPGTMAEENESENEGVHGRMPRTSLPNNPPYEEEGFRRVEVTALSQLQVCILCYRFALCNRNVTTGPWSCCSIPVLTPCCLPSWPMLDFSHQLCKTDEPWSTARRSRTFSFQRESRAEG